MCVHDPCPAPQCTNHGTCVRTGGACGPNDTTCCREGDSTCTAQCVCDSGYSGAACQLTLSEAAAEEEVQEARLVQQRLAVSTSALTPAGLRLHAATLASSLSEDSLGVGVGSGARVLDVLQQLLGAGSSAPGPAAIRDLFRTVVALAGVASGASPAGQTRALLADSGAEVTTGARAALQQLLTLALADALPGQDPVVVQGPEGTAAAAQRASLTALIEGTRLPVALPPLGAWPALPSGDDVLDLMAVQLGTASGGGAGEVQASAVVTITIVPQGSAPFEAVAWTEPGEVCVPRQPALLLPGPPPATASCIRRLFFVPDGGRV